MNVLFLNQYALPSGAAGITRHGDIGAELVRRGHMATVIASDFDYLTRRPRHGPASTDHDGVRFVWLNTGSYSGNDQRRVRSLLRYTTGAFSAALRVRPRPDVIIGSSPNLLAALSAATAARVLRRPWVFEVRDFWPSALVDLGAIAAGGRTHRALEAVERRLYLDADAVVTIPPHGNLRLDELGVHARRWVHIPNATAMGSMAEAILPSTLETILARLEGRFVIGYTGALGVTHDLDSLFAGLRLLREERTDRYDRLGVLFVGDGIAKVDAEATARRLRLDSTHFHHAVGKATVGAFLMRVDAGLMAAGRSEYFKYGLSPNKLFDYFAAGKPVLISAADPTVVDEADAGLRFTPGNPRAFADAIARMMDLAPEERAAMGDRGRELARARYSIPAVTDKYEELLQHLVRRRS